MNGLGLPLFGLSTILGGVLICVGQQKTEASDLELHNDTIREERKAKWKKGRQDHTYELVGLEIGGSTEL